MNRNYNNQQTTCEINGKMYHFRSLLEKRYAFYLETLRKCGHIDRWLYEDKSECKFIFHGVTTSPVNYLSDFAIFYKAEHGVQRKELHETKGWLEGRDVSKFRRMASHYPEENIVLVMMQSDSKRHNRYRTALKYIERIHYVKGDFRKLGIN